MAAVWAVFSVLDGGVSGVCRVTALPAWVDTSRGATKVSAITDKTKIRTIFFISPSQNYSLLVTTHVSRPTFYIDEVFTFYIFTHTYSSRFALPNQDC
jgi:hypothetical protein